MENVDNFVSEAISNLREAIDFCTDSSIKNELLYFKDRLLLISVKIEMIK